MSQTRTYQVSETISFSKTAAPFGGLSNMAPGYSVNINGIIIPSSEHLYQACRFPFNPEIQEAIILESNPMKAKWISRKYIDESRKDWDSTRIKIMKWCLTIKLSQNWHKFSALLAETGNKPIVEFTKKDKLWGAIQEGDFYIGTNALGRLLMEVRDNFVYQGLQPYCVEAPLIENFMLFSSEIGLVCNDVYHADMRYSSMENFEMI